MTPVIHMEATPRVPGDSPSGKKPKQYPAGRVCVACPTVLRRTNPGPWCDPCLNKDAKVQSRATACGPPASACSSAAPTAAPAVRAKKEEKVGKESLREAVLLTFARDPSRCFNASDVVKSSGVSPSCVYKNLKALVESGDLVKDAPGVYRWPKIEDTKTAPTSPPASAPASPPPEQPADVAPAPELLRPQAGLAPFAGIDYELDPDDEIEALEICVLQLGRLGPLARDRVMTYLASRFMVDWPDAKEK